MDYKDLNTALRTALLTALNGQLTLNNANVPVYDRVPKSIRFPFVVIQLNDTNDEARTKDHMLYNSTTTINIITGYEGNFGGQADCDSLADQILQILGNTSASYISLGANFEIVTQRLQGNQVSESQTETHYIVQKSLVLTNIINQIN